MTTEISEANNVRAAACCHWCGQFDHASGKCRRLNCDTFPTDVCDNWEETHSNLTINP